MNYLRYIYLMLRAETFNLDSVYEDYIIQLVGTTGLEELKKANLIESCGVVNGRQLYTVVGRGCGEGMSMKIKHSPLEDIDIADSIIIQTENGPVTVYTRESGVLNDELYEYVIHTAEKILTLLIGVCGGLCPE